MGGEVKAETLGHSGVVEGQIAHDAHDGFAADFVFVGHEIATGEGGAAGIECSVVFGQLFFVLPIGIGNLGNGGHAK